MDRAIDGPGDVLDRFLPPVASWFSEQFGSPTLAQRLGWPAIASGQNALIVAPTGSGILSPVETFQDDDAGYRAWIWANLDGFVVNAQRGANPGEPVLHRATCDTITPTPDREWTTQYVKICSTKRFELDSWARSHDRRLTACVFCDP